MFNITLATLFLLPEEVEDRNELPLLTMVWKISVELAIVFLSIWILFGRSLHFKRQQEMAERERKLAELVSEFKQVLIYAQGLITDADDFVIPFHETMMGFFEVRDLIAGGGAPGETPTVATAADAAVAAGVEISSSASCPHNKFMRKAEECFVLIAFARKALCDLFERGYDDAVAQAGPIDARYVHGLAEFKRRMAELEAQWELEPDSDSDLEYDDLKDGDKDEDENDGMPSLFHAYDNQTRIVSFCDENGVIIPKTQD
ncbi:hypothetical protein LY78DRAFT_701007 [Colletotrichum sublineola]|uniref:Uncharacterized protein n=1 Tax=Colletotrichum sublineola TaxID=1173701 RepID=A0A066XJ90_COLSU|nr:hypothetical protein LY78DRAFT_701007 [Colletotrichum sublineola]KDN66095.1 hypothetical protein CSUB01_01546 [Colletotrichum sublineola]